MVMLRKLISLYILIIVKSDESNGKDCDIDDDIVKKKQHGLLILKHSFEWE
jgi:hypothetical protein